MHLERGHDAVRFVYILHSTCHKKSNDGDNWRDRPCGNGYPNLSTLSSCSLEVTSSNPVSMNGWAIDPSSAATKTVMGADLLTEYALMLCINCSAYSGSPPMSRTTRPPLSFAIAANAAVPPASFLTLSIFATFCSCVSPCSDSVRFVDIPDNDARSPSV